MQRRIGLVARGLVAVGAAAWAASLLGGCNQVLGIHPAEEESDAGTSDDAGPSNDPLDCENYCAVITQNCQGEYQEYLPSLDGGMGVCLGICKQFFTVGTYSPYPGADPPNADTLGCRLWHAHSAGDPASGGPSVHCRHAGPLGTDLCGGPVQPFCNIDWTYCFDDQGIATYASPSACAEAINTAMSAAQDAGASFYDEQDSGDINDPTGAGIETGDTLNCRIWHLETSMQTNDPMEHCPHTEIPSSVFGSDGGGPCSN